MNWQARLLATAGAPAIKSRPKSLYENGVHDTKSRSSIFKPVLSGTCKTTHHPHEHRQDASADSLAGLEQLVKFGRIKEFAYLMLKSHASNTF